MKNNVTNPKRVCGGVGGTYFEKKRKVKKVTGKKI